MAQLWQGEIADVAFYDHALSRKQVKQAYRYLRRKYRLLWWQRLYDWLVKLTRNG